MATEQRRTGAASAPDQQLIARFIREREESVFEEIVRRHSRLVLGVCRRVLGDVHDAEDAFQATFLILVRDARKIRKRESLASWLHAVAYRVSVKAAKRRSRQMLQPLDDVAASDDLPLLDRIAQRHEQQLIDLELRQLGDRDREPLILHYLEERSNRDIADALGISVAAVEGRLKRAKVRLRRRLLRRGVALGALLGVLVESQKTVCAADALVKSTTALAMGSGGLVPHASLRELVSSEIREMALVGSKQMLAIGAAVATISITLGLCGLSGHVVGQDSPTAVAVPAQAEEPQAAPVKMVPSVLGAVPALNAMPGYPDNARRRAMQRILTKLEDEIVLEFNEAPLSEVVDFLKSSQAIPIVINDRALDDVGLGADTPVNVSISGVSLRSALALMLESLDLDFTIRHEVLMITTAEDAGNHLDARVVPLQGIQLSSDKLIEVITKSVAPDSWEEVGGAGTITALGPEFNAVVVSQTLKVHEQIADLLDQLRAIGAEPPTVVPVPAVPGEIRR